MSQTQDRPSMPISNPFARMQPTGLYLHVPFCPARCHYCAFYSQRPEAEDFRLYTRTLIHEIKRTVPAEARLTSLYLGGGTPSFLPLLFWEEIFDTLKGRLADGAEITLEANPSADLPKKLPRFRALGVNRLSLGLQSADNRQLKTLGRIHSREGFEASLKAAWEAGFDNISADLIFGLPGQTLADFFCELHEVLAFPLTHLSFYGLQLEEGTPLGDALLADPSPLPPEEEERNMYHALLDELPAAGFQLYEISSAAKPGFESRHNRLYWQGRPYWGCGPAAASYVGGCRRSNPSDLRIWAEKILASDAPFAAAVLDETVDGEGAAAEFAMLSFRLLRGLVRADYRALFHEEAEARFASVLETLRLRGLILETQEGWSLSRRGLDLANQVFSAFL